MNRETRDAAEAEEWGVRAGKADLPQGRKGRFADARWFWWISRPSAARRDRIRSLISKPSIMIRELFASTPEADRRGYSAGHFSFNIPGGRCETCQGDGTVTVEMQFLADVELVCDDCKGTRFKPSVLDVKYHGLNIHEVLQLTVKEAISFFSATPRLVAEAESAE